MNRYAFTSRVRMLVGGTALALAAAVLSIPGTASAATGAITGYGGKCVDIAGANPTNGTPVQLYDCNGTAAQQWTTPGDGTIRALGKCLDATNAGTTNGTRIQIWDCNGTGAQQWRIETSKDIVNIPANRCLDATGPSSANGTPLQLWDCTGAANQKWTTPTGGGTTPPPTGPAGRAAAPYLYQWGSPPNPTTVMSATGVRWFTLAFILSGGTCNPMWDGARGLTGGSDQSLINSIRGAGGDVVVSFGGWSGNKLGESCTSASALAGAYQKVINAYGLKAIDLDIEATEYSNTTVQQRIVDALKTIRANNPGLVIYVTIGTGTSGPDRGLINRAAAAGLAIDGWTIMPFDFGGAGQNMGNLTLQAAEGLKSALRSAYGYGDTDAYHRMGISSMNGVTDNQEIVTQADFTTMLGYVQQHGLARFTFWALNRDRQCGSGGDATSSCSGISQASWDFTKIIARYQG